MKVIKNTLLFGIKIVAAVAAAVHVLRGRMGPSNRLAFSVRNNAINHTERRIRMNLDKYPDVLTLRECQKILQVSRGTMLRLLHEGEIPAFRIGNRWRIQRKEMLEFIERSEY